VHDSARPDRDAPENSRSRPFRADNRLVIAVAFVIMCLGILTGGHLYGRYFASFNSASIDNTITELVSLTAMDIKLQSAQATLDSIMPPPNTYMIKPNQTLIVGDGHLPVGIVGPVGLFY
jgi:hypothetical protein